MYQIQLQKNILNNGYNNGVMRAPVDGANSEYHSLILQIDSEYKAAEAVLKPRVEEWQRRLKLYNNQKRDQDAVGDRLLYTTMQTVLASLYDDQMLVEFKGTDFGDEEVADNLNNLAKHDFRVMKKDVFDYFWLFDTCFFGRSIVYFTEFNRDRQNTPIPDLQNPMLFYKDPKAVAVNGDAWNGRNAARFFGRWIEMTKPQMQANPEFFDIDSVKPSLSTNSELQINRQAYQDANGLQSSFDTEEDKYGDNCMYDLLEWCTHWNGKKVLVTLANDRQKVVRLKEFKHAGKPATEWPVLDRTMSPISHSWEAVSIPDITEDDQRIRAILKNLGIKHMKADLYPMFVYNKKRFKNPNFDLAFNKGIPIEGEGSINDSIQPLQKSQLNVAFHNYIMEMLATDAEKATATPQMQQGTIDTQRRTATELNKVDRNVGTRYSLTAKIFGWSEKAFWTQWYRLYKDNYRSLIDEKVVRIEGALGSKFRPFTRENIIADQDPDIEIVSKYVRDMQRREKQQEYAAYLNYAAQVPNVNLPFGIKQLGRLQGMEKDDLERLFPPTIEELQAQEENKLLNKGKFVPVNASDDHHIHLIEHAKAADNQETFKHVETHKEALRLYKANPSLMPTQQRADKERQQQSAQQGERLASVAGSSTPAMPETPSAVTTAMPQV